MNDFSVGDRIYITQRAPEHLRGVTGTVAAVRGDEIYVSQRGGAPIVVPREFVLRDRRRKHRPFSWGET